MQKQLFFHAEQHQTATAAHHRVARHQLRVGKALVDVFVDDVGLVQNQIALHQHRHLVVGVHHRQVFGFVEYVDIFDFKVHAFFVQHKTAALAEGASNA